MAFATESRVWCPHVTVATVVPQDGRYLLVEEIVHGRTVINQPAGHLEPGESLQAAAIRETREETGWDVELDCLIGVQQWISSACASRSRPNLFTMIHPGHSTAASCARSGSIGTRSSPPAIVYAVR